MGYIFVLLSAFCFSVTNIILKKGMAHSKGNGVWFITFINVVFLGITYVISLLISNKTHFFNSTGVLLFAISGILISVIGRTLLYSGIRKIGSSKAVAIKNSAPIFTLIFAIFVIKEQITFWPLVGIAFIFLGLFLLGFQFFKEEVKDIKRTGYWISLCSAIGFGLGQGISKYASLSLNNPFLGVFIATLVAFLCLTTIEVFRGDLLSIVKTSFTRSNKYYLWAGILTSAALLFFYISISYIHVSYAVALLAADPVFTVILGVFFLKKEEKISPLIFVVVILIFLGAGIISIMGS